MIAIPREGNKTMTFGYADGNKDVTYTSAVDQQGQITVVTDPTPEDELKPLWGDVNDDGVAGTAKDIVAMMQYMVSYEDANLTKQGIVNGNLDQSDGLTEKDLSDKDKAGKILGVKDFNALKKFILGYDEFKEDKLPIKK
jgi:hypothetical protein